MYRYSNITVSSLAWLPRVSVSVAIAEEVHVDTVLLQTAGTVLNTRQ